MYWDRFDICEAWYFALSHCHGGGGSSEYLRLCQMGEYFTPSPLLTVESLTENGLVIYKNACQRLLEE